MNFEEELQKGGYYEALAQYESMLRQREFRRANEQDFANDDTEEFKDAVAEIDAILPDLKTKLDTQYAAIMKRVDAENDLDLSREALIGQLEIIADACEEKQPETSDWIRRVLAGEDVGPIPKPRPVEQKDATGPDE